MTQAQPRNLIDPVAWIRKWMENGGAASNWRPLIYLAHPVAPRPGEVIARCTACKAEHAFMPSDQLDLRVVCDHDDPVRHTGTAEAIVAYNLRRALEWWRWFTFSLKEATFIMPWFVDVTASADDNPEARAVGLENAHNTVMRCDAVIYCGERVSSGMATEGGTAREFNDPVFQVPGWHGRPPGGSSAREVMWQEVQS